MDLNIEQFEKMPLSQKALILIVLILAVGSLWYYLLYSKEITKLENLTGEYKTLNDDLGVLLKKQGEMKILQNTIDNQKKEITKYKERLPTQTQMDQLLIKIDDIGKKNGLFFDEFRPKKPVDKDNTYTEVGIKLDITGMYPYIMNFFYETVTMQRIVKFNAIKITLAKKTGGGSGPQMPGQVKVTCEASIFKFLAEKPAPPPKAPAAGGAGATQPAGGGAPATQPPANPAN